MCILCLLDFVFAYLNVEFVSPFKYDNGILLCDLGGFELLKKCINSSSELDLRKEAVKVLGSAIQR